MQLAIGRNHANANAQNNPVNAYNANANALPTANNAKHASANARNHVGSATPGINS